MTAPPTSPPHKAPHGANGRRNVTRPPRIDPAAIAETLGTTGGGRRPRLIARRLVRWGIALLAIGAGIWYFVVQRGPEPTSYVTAVIRHGDLAVTVSATGRLAPLDTVDVGTEVSGIVDRVTVDFNDHVRRGQVLAVVNTDQLRAQIRQSEAALRAAQASARQGSATLAEVRGQAIRAESLFARAMISPQDLEGAHASLQRAEASVATSEAQISSAEAALDAQRTTLGKATIRSPIDGIVLERTVEPGRTVAATFQTPVLFVLAADLTRMTLALDIDEADIAQVAAGQDVQFTVDAFPTRSFGAKVRSVHNAARTVEGVVTYQAILDVANPDRSLRPGMTATASIVTAEVHDARLVPNAALRFTPAGDTTATRPGTRRVWTLRQGVPVAVPLTVGLSDGKWTVVTEGGPAPGDTVVTDARVAGSDASATTSTPSTPLRPRGFRGPFGD